MESILKAFIQPTAVLFVLILLLIVNGWIFKRIKSTVTTDSIAKSAITFFLMLVGTLIFILVLPIDKSSKGQVLSFLGIVLSAGIALSSTTVLGNLIAGLMNNSMKRFRNGDLIKIGNYHGRVIRKSIFHTEVQLEDSNFITIPNLYIANNPVKLTRKTKTVISTSVSLGYDISRKRIENALIEAALATGLTDPYVYISSLGDFSVVYKIHGFLEDSSTFFSTNSLLNAKVMDQLHQEKIEIVSPTFMNQRRVDEQEFIPKVTRKENVETLDEPPEDLVFDEAIKSEKIEAKKEAIQKIEAKQKELKESLKDEKEKTQRKKIKQIIEKQDEIKEQIEKNIEKEISDEK